MGNAAGKLEETELGVGSLHKDEGKSRCIDKAFCSSEDGITKIKSKGKTWVTAEEGDNETLLWKSISVGMIRSHSVIQSSTGKPVAIIITEKKGLASSTNYVCRPMPSYEGQSPLTEEELQKAGVKETMGESLYKFSKIETSNKLTSGKCTYGLVTGEEDIVPLYEGEKLSSLSFKAIFKEITSTENEGLVVAKAFMPGFSMSPHVDAAIGVDLLAIVSIGYSLAGDHSSAGAMAGAGVI